MGDLAVVTTGERHDLDGQARDALRTVWPEFIFHDPVVPEYIGRVETYFPQYDVLLLDDGQVVAGGWGVPIRWDGTVGTLPDGYDGALVSAVTGHEDSTPADTLCIMAAAVKADRQGGEDAHRPPGASVRRWPRARRLTGQASPEEPVSIGAHGKLRQMDAQRRAAHRPVDPDAPATWSKHPRARAALHDHHWHRRRMGRLGGDGIP